jgi:hypothetical protein
VTDKSQQKRGGRPEFHAEKFRGQVKAMAAYGIPQADISNVIGCDPKTLRKHFRAELETGATEANAKVAQFLFNGASGAALKDKALGATYADCARQAMFWAKTRMQWRETNHTLHGNDPDNPMPPTRIVIEAAKPDDDSQG